MYNWLKAYHLSQELSIQLKTASQLLQYGKHSCTITWTKTTRPNLYVLLIWISERPQNSSRFHLRKTKAFKFMAMTVQFLSLGAPIWMSKKQPASRQSFNRGKGFVCFINVQADFMSVLHIIKTFNSGNFHFVFEEERQESKFQWQLF